MTVLHLRPGTQVNTDLYKIKMRGNILGSRPYSLKGLQVKKRLALASLKDRHYCSKLLLSNLQDITSFISHNIATYRKMNENSKKKKSSFKREDLKIVVWYTPLDMCWQLVGSALAQQLVCEKPQWWKIIRTYRLLTHAVMCQSSFSLSFTCLF